MEKRLFLSIQLPEPTKEILDSYKKIPAHPELVEGWTKKENLHVTLYFLGKIEEEIIPNLIDSLNSKYKNIKPFMLKFEKITFAPPNKKARMIWAQFEKNKDYQHLFDATPRAVQNFLNNNQIINKTKEQIPHVTLARFRIPININKIDLKQPKISDLQVNSCQLMESQLNSEGPIYSTLATFSFDKL